MSQHTSLKVKSVGVKHRNVLKRYERIRKMEADGKWEDRKSIFGLPKIKSIKIKVRKAKSEATAAGATEAQAAAPATPNIAKAAPPAAAKPTSKAK